MWKKLKNLPKLGGLPRGLSGSKFLTQKHLVVKVAFFLLALGLGLIFNEAFKEYADTTLELKKAGAEQNEKQQFRNFLPMAGKGVGAVMAAIAFLIALWASDKQSIRKQRWLVLLPLCLASIGALLAWLPTDVFAMQGALAGKAVAGENPSIPAYIGKLVLIGFLILSPPIVTAFFFRLELMDQYLVKAFLGPFLFSMIAFVSIFVIFDFTDNGPAFTGAPQLLARFYAVQIPFVISFIMPIVIPLALLYSLTNLSKSNEFISMIGTGRSVMRVLMPLIFIGGYLSIIALALKYQWAPEAEGEKEALMTQAKEQRYYKSKGIKMREVLWVKTGWMHINDYANRTWFIGQVPLKLSDPMVNVMIWERDADGQPVTMWQAKRANWDWETKQWNFTQGKVFKYQEDHTPRITPFKTLALKDWNETPWKVISSAQEPDFLGLAGLTMFLNANKEMPEKDLARFRTNWWIIFAEPFCCFVMVLVAAPFGIVYGRKGALGGFVTAAIILALTYVFSITFKSLGHGNKMPPFWAAWTCNIIIGVLGVILLWFKSRNRDLPKLKNLFTPRRA